ncbi:TIGR01244 family sulfur transferase [Brevundimonas vesicularis]|uniref:TIGR01244 family sulfur transferase n=1 Tax=Brevundimonas vesicularis TaxID=41276 RepID=UPI0038D4FC66
MSHPVALNDTTYVAGQIDPASLSSLAAELGIRRVVSNRPDHEEPGQPTAEEVRQAAEAAGLDFLFAPVRGMPSPDAVAQTAAFMDQEGATLMFCRSGMRSTVIWALAEASRGADPTALRQAAFEAGYDLTSLPL